MSIDQLRSLIRELESVVIGYSGGVDSTLLAKVATDELGERAVCVLIDSCLTPGIEIREAIEQAERLGLNLVRLQVDALATPNVPENPVDRCYYCKIALFSEMQRIARERGIRWVVDGANADDVGDYRPGMRATKELDVRSPFLELGITKDQIRAISRELGLSTWNKPSYACLASRVPYGTRLTGETLKRIESAEAVLRGLDFTQFRVRHHDDTARIELVPSEMNRMLDRQIRDHVVREFRELGYRYVCLDLLGYRTGSLNEAIDQE